MPLRFKFTYADVFESGGMWGGKKKTSKFVLCSGAVSLWLVTRVPVACDTCRDRVLCSLTVWCSAKETATFEKTCVLFNLAALYSEVGKAANLNTDDGQKTAAKSFQVHTMLT